MAKVIIGIHGLGNKPRKEVLEKWWKKSMIEGLEKLNKPYKLPRFEMVYWADVIYDKPLDENITDIYDPYYISEKYIPGLANPIAENNSLRQRVLNFIEEQLDKLFLNADFTVNYSRITDMLIHRYFRDLELYYAKKCNDKNDIRCVARTLIRERLALVLDKYKHDEIILISHSMGSIIAYDVLTFLMPEINIHSFISLGSPLGFPVVQGKIASEWQSKKIKQPNLKTPPGVTNQWYNFADLRDKVAMIYQLSKNFEANGHGIVPKDFVVHNDYQTEIEPNHHKSFGYLRTPELAEVLYPFIYERNTFQKLKSKVDTFFHSLAILGK